MPKFLHTGDIHLDSPFYSLDEKHSEIRKNELRAAFTSMLTYARTYGVDVVLIAGDCFDSRYATRDTVALMRDGFEGLSKTRIVVSPGNHDPYTSDSVWARTPMPRNVTVFNAAELQKVSFDDIGTDVYGYAFTAQDLEYFPAEGRTVDDYNKINILCAHGELNAPLSKNCPMTPAMLESFGADYAALGHIHKGGVISSAGKTAYAYCGCIEGRDFGECGYKGAIVFDATKRGSECDIKAGRVRFSKRRYECVEVNVNGAKSNTDLKKALAAAISGKYGDDTALRVIFTGAVDPSLTVSASAFDAKETGVFALDIADATVPLFDAAYLEGDISVRGELYRRLLPAMRDGSPEQRRLACAAFRYAMSALEGQNLT